MWCECPRRLRIATIKAIWTKSGNTNFCFCEPVELWYAKGLLLLSLLQAFSRAPPNKKHFMQFTFHLRRNTLMYKAYMLLYVSSRTQVSFTAAAGRAFPKQIVYVARRNFQMLLHRGKLKDKIITSTVTGSNIDWRLDKAKRPSSQKNSHCYFQLQ